MRNPLPASYYYFFWLVEPALTLCGAIYAIFLPEKYASELLPPHYERVTTIMGNTVRGQIVIGGLGSCFLLLAMISLSLFPIIKHTLKDQPAAQAKLVKGLLIPLAIADLTHIFVTLIPMPMSLLETPQKWTTLVNGNVWITTVLFIVRVSYLLGIGRKKTASPSNTLAAIENDTKKVPHSNPSFEKDSKKVPPTSPSVEKDTKKAQPGIPAVEDVAHEAPSVNQTPVTPSKTPRRRTRVKEAAHIETS
ncbi:hypothetical protein BCR39DRAFT_524678 [Naematelia encephala]|uniref:DUF7704 domain-containing protein n=1 Tax=Naematelia encephala TaxID=71784 RepID=A0A1Y2BAZ3_9TREE|nr:hypothetical protein BCR39DRAFT_524678 [Naematelia encephala]